MNVVLQKILSWSEERPLWQRDALRRIVEKNVIEDADIKELIEICKGERDADPLAEKHLPLSPASSGTVTLASLGNPQNINALASKTMLTFEPQGLTVIYGDNASGKSGYNRVLKHLCRARSREDIHPNVFAASIGKQKVSVSYDVDGTRQTQEWEVGTVSPQMLGHVSVFDSQCAEHYVGQKNEVEFVPFGLDLFNKLADISTRMKTSFDTEINALDQAQDALQELQGTTLAATFIQNLKFDTQQGDIETMGKLSKDEEERLVFLSQQIAQIRSNDPKRKQSELSTRIARIQKLKEHLADVEKSLSQSAIKEVRDAKEKSDNCDAAALASQKVFSDNLLVGTGGEVWRAMWETARVFSASTAYPHKTYPHTGDGAKCVLCQQTLETEASQRVQQFEEFVQQETQKNAQDAREKLLAKRSTIVTLSTDPIAWEAAIADVQQEDEITAATVKQFFTHADDIKNTILLGCDSAKWNTENEKPFPSVPLQKIIEKLERQVQDFVKAENPQEKAKLETELADLNARKAIGTSVPRIMRELKRRATRSILHGFRNETDTNAITRTHSSLGKEYINDKLCTCFVNELKALGVNYLHIELDCTGEKGGSKHKILLKKGHEGDYTPSQVLSEGEHRSVAIALFLSELATADHGSGIVFDDPTSSLDHKWQEKIARRLVKEAKNRQVVVFTHDIIFLLYLQECIAEDVCPARFQYVSKGANGTGIRFEGLPFEVASIESKIRYLHSELHKLKKVEQEGDEATYKRQVRDFYSLLRSAWERAIEERLLNSAVQRFNRDIMTQRLRIVAGDIHESDFQAIDTAMTCCSRITSAHDTAAGINPVMPTTDEIGTDIQTLTTWIEAISKRRK